MELKDYVNSKQEFIKCLNLNPEYHFAMIGLSNVYYTESDFKKAEDLLRYALTIDPDETQSVISLGNTLMARKV